MKRELIRITFVGDIMCERPLLKAYFMNKGYDFRPVFEATKKLFNESDFVIGNLETVFAGKEVGYTNSLYSFNTPDEFLDALKESGIDLFLTANNHCLDRGIDGLKRTIHELDSRNMAHIGTYLNEKEQKKIFVKDIHGIKIAFLNYTYGTGIKDNHVILEKKDQDCVNLLMPQKLGSPIRYNKRKNKVSFLKRNISKLFSEDTKLRIKKKLGKSVGAPRTDELWDELIDYKLLDVLKNDIKQAKKVADYVVLNIHNGGQFNAEPGEYSKYIMKFCVESGADVVVGNHPHVVQKRELIDNTLCAFSLGNYSISPSTPYMLFENYPQYSIALHVCFDKEKVQIAESSFSVLKILEDSKHRLKVVDTFDWAKTITGIEKEKLQEEVQFICEQFTCQQYHTFELKQEYKVFGE